MNNKTNRKKAKSSTAEKELPEKYPRKFIQYAKPDDDCPRVNVVSWNILAQTYVRNSLFPYAKHSVLSFKSRFTAIIADMVSMDADFFCLQEVDKFSDLLGHLRRVGYEGIFKKRTRAKRDGCAIFWKTSRFQLVQQCEVSYNKLFKKYNRNEFYRTDNVGMIALFKLITNGNNISNNSTTTSQSPSNDNNVDSQAEEISDVTQDLEDTEIDTEDTFTEYAEIGPGNYLCVANTHLFWNPMHPDVKFEQMKMFLESIADFNSKHHPVIICGDLNSKPDSAVYELLQQRRVRIFHPEFSVKPPSLTLEDDEIVPANATKELNMLSLDSAYGKYLPATDSQDQACGLHEPPFTNYQQKFQGTLDYIFFEKDKFSLEAVLDMPPLESMTFEIALPNSHYPSDHLPIQCVLKSKYWSPNNL